MKRFCLLLAACMPMLFLACKNDTKISIPDAQMVVVDDVIEEDPNKNLFINRYEDTVDWVGTYNGNLDGVDTRIKLYDDKSGEIEIKKGTKVEKTTFSFTISDEGYFQVFVDGVNHEYKILDEGIVDVNAMMDGIGKEGEITRNTEKKFLIAKKM